MATIIKEQKYIVYIGAQEHVLRVQELLSGQDSWPEKFRALLPASPEWTATMVYGSTEIEAAERAMKYLSSYAFALSPLGHTKPC